jgi:hypothetical protein
MSFNDYPDVSAPDPPFGRIRNKRSGYGKELSNLGIEKSVDRKLVLMQTSPSKVQAMKEINRMVANKKVQEVATVEAGLNKPILVVKVIWTNSVGVKDIFGPIPDTGGNANAAIHSDDARPDSI